MATEPKVATEDAKIDLFEDDDEFEEFEINEGNINFVILVVCFNNFQLLLSEIFKIFINFWSMIFTV